MKLLPVLALAALSAGCAMQPSAIELQQRRVADETRPTCAGEEECRVKWEAAQLWVTKNADYKIQVATTVLLETFNPPLNSPLMGMRITKEPLGGGRYRFDLDAWCNNMFGCRAEPLALRLRFNQDIGNVVP